MTIAMVLLPAMLGVLWLMYDRGALALHRKRAMLFTGSLDGCKARFSGCTGSVRRVLRVRESRLYRFELDMALTRGEVCAELYTPNKCLLRLDRQNALAEIPLEKGKRYRLVFCYRAAAGRHELKYQ